MTSNEFRTTSNEPGKNTSNRRNEIVLKSGTMHESIKINDECLDEILNKNDFNGYSYANYL